MAHEQAAHSAADREKSELDPGIQPAPARSIAAVSCIANFHAAGEGLTQRLISQAPDKPSFTMDANSGLHLQHLQSSIEQEPACSMQHQQSLARVDRATLRQCFRYVWAATPTEYRRGHGITA